MAKQTAWNSLPADTVFAMRIPNGGKFLSVLGEKTNLGTLLRLEGEQLDLLKCLNPKFVTKLQQIKLLKNEKVGDEFDLNQIKDIFAGELGVAIVANQKLSDDNAYITLGWLEPEEESATYLYELYNEYINKSNEKKELKIQQKKIDNTNVCFVTDIKNNKFFFAICKLNNRIVIAAAKRNGLNKQDDDKIFVALEQTISKFIVAQHNNGDKFVADMYEIAGLKKSLSKGDVIVDLLCSLKKVATLIGNNDEFMRKYGMYIKMLQLDSNKTNGAIAMRISMQNNDIYSSMFMEDKKSMNTILGIFRQSEIDLQVPSWVPAKVLSYSKFSLNATQLLKVLEMQLKKIVGEPIVDMQKKSLDMLLQNRMQMNLQQLLQEIGNDIEIVNWNYKDDDIATIKDSSLKIRTVIIANIKEPLYKKLKVLITEFAKIYQIDFLEKEGFWGIGIKTLGSIYINKNKLVVALGTTEPTMILTAINHHNSKQKKLLNLTQYQKIKEKLGIDRGIAFKYSNVGQSMVNMIDYMGKIVHVNVEAKAEEGEMDNDISNFFKNIINKDEKIIDCFGDSFFAVQATKDGFVAKGVLHLNEKK